MPIQAMAVRELIYDAAGKVVPQPKPDPKKKRAAEAERRPIRCRTGPDAQGHRGRVPDSREGKAIFMPVKTGIAGDKYFEVLDGLKAGDEVITGPFNSVRDLKEGDAREARGAEGPHLRRPAASQRMQKFIDAIRLALSAIWAGKLRSFMTVLGNIVAVTSIIAVVSLIRGMNSYVSDAILTDVGAGTFKVERQGPTTSEEEEERQRNNPRITLVELDTLAKAGDTIESVMAQAYNGAPVVYRDEQLDTRADPRRLEGIPRVRRLRPGARPAAQPLRGRARRGRSRYLGWGTADRLFKGAQPRSTAASRSAASTSASSASTRRRARSSATRRTSSSSSRSAPSRSCSARAAASS